MTKFGKLFALKESLAIMIQMSNLKDKKNVKQLRLGDKAVSLDLRLLTTTKSKGI